MIHPSYVELLKVVNNNVEIGEEPVVNSRYSFVIAAAIDNGLLHLGRAISGSAPSIIWRARFAAAITIE